MQQRPASYAIPLVAAAFFAAGCGDKKPAEPQVRTDITFERVAGNPSSEADAINGILKGGASNRGVYWVINTTTRRGFLVMYGTDNRRLMPGESFAAAPTRPDVIAAPPNDGKVLLIPVTEAYDLLGGVAAGGKASKEKEDVLRSLLPPTPSDIANPSSPVVTIRVRSTDPLTLNTDFSRLQLEIPHIIRLPVPTDKESNRAACFGKLTQEPVVRSFNCLGLNKDAIATGNDDYNGALKDVRDQHRTCASLLCEMKPAKISGLSQTDLFAFLDRQLALYAYLSDNLKAVSLNESKPVPRAPA